VPRYIRFHPGTMGNPCHSDNALTSRRGVTSQRARTPGTRSFDSSASVKWSAVGWNRAETIEVVFFQTPYSAPTLFYGRIP
jgi:hypothetical protein